MKMKKMKRFLISGLLAGCWAACNSNDYKMYSGEAYIQFSETKDILLPTRVVLKWYKDRSKGKIMLWPANSISF